MQFDREKLKAVVLYIFGASKPDRLGAVKLHKVLYFSDMIHYAQTGKPITGAIYRKRPFGPTCDALLSILSQMQRDGLIEIKTVDYFGHRKTEYFALAGGRPDSLSESEILLLDEVIDFVCNRNSAKTISEYSHKAPWERANFGEPISYSSAYLLYPSQVSPEGFEATEHGFDEIEASQSQRDALVFTSIEALRSRVREARAGG